MFESESPETRQQLDALEQRLRLTRPQPPRLDVAALMREADEQIVQPRPSLVQRNLWFAGSWACGAAIGALVMFVLMSGSTSEADQETAVESRVTPVLEDEHVPRALHSPSPRLANEDPSESIGSISMLPLDFLLDDSRSSYLTDETLQVGMYLRRRIGNERQAMVRRNRVETRDVEGKRLEADSFLQPRPSPSRPITRQKLIQELLEDPVGSIL